MTHFRNLTQLVGLLYNAIAINASFVDELANLQDVERAKFRPNVSTTASESIVQRKIQQKIVNTYRDQAKDLDDLRKTYINPYALGRE